MTNDNNGNYRKFHLELLVAKNFVKTIINALKTSNNSKEFATISKKFPNFQVITEDSEYWHSLYLDCLQEIIYNVSSNRMLKKDAITALRSVENRIQNEIYYVQKQIHYEYIVALTYVRDIINFLGTYKKSNNSKNQLQNYINQHPTFNYIDINRIITCLNQVYSDEVEISKAIIRLQRVEKSISSALRTK